MSTIVELQQIVADESRSVEERKQAAELILAMQGQKEAVAVEQRRSERRAQFPRAQQRLATNLSLGNPAFNLVESKTNVTATVDKIAVMQIIRAMLDDDGNDGLIYAAWGWNSQSSESLADRMGDHQSQHECNPAYRLGMQSVADQKAYVRREMATLKVPYVELPPERRLEDAVRMTSEQFARFAVDFHRKALAWELKQFVFDHLNTPGTEFFPAFISLQGEADAQEEAVYKNAYAAHLRATDPNLGEDEAADFLEMLSSMRGRENLEAERRAKRIAARRPSEPLPSCGTQALPALEPELLVTKQQVASALAHLDLQLEKIKAEQRSA